MAWTIRKDEPSAQPFDEVMAHFERLAILDHFVSFVDPSHRAFDGRLVREVQRVPGLLLSLQWRSKGGRFKTLLDMAATGQPEPVDNRVGIAWKRICKGSGFEKEAILRASDNRWVGYQACVRARLIALTQRPDAKRPNLSMPEGAYLQEISRDPKSPTYDAAFHMKLWEVRPDWCLDYRWPHPPDGFGYTATATPAPFQASEALAAADRKNTHDIYRLYRRLGSDLPVNEEEFKQVRAEGVRIMQSIEEERLATVVKARW